MRASPDFKVSRASELQILCEGLGFEGWTFLERCWGGLGIPGSCVLILGLMFSGSPLPKPYMDMGSCQNYAYRNP